MAAPYDPYPLIDHRIEDRYFLADGREVPLIQLVIAYNELVVERKARQAQAGQAEAAPLDSPQRG